MSLGLQIEITDLIFVFRALAEEGDVSMRMDSTRGGLSLQVSNRDWDEADFHAALKRSGRSRRVEVESNGSYGWIVRPR